MAPKHVGPNIPNPGSDKALDMGCRCPVLDNSYGRGYYGQPGRFVINASCPVHGQKPKAAKYSSIYPEEEPHA